MPVSRGPRVNLRSALVVGFTGVTVALVLGVGAIWLARSSGDVEIRLGDTDFQAGNVERIAAEIAEHGPILYSDVAGHSRDIILAHAGDDPTSGWQAFAARPIGVPRSCFFQWDSSTARFSLIAETDESGDGQCAAVTMDSAGTLSTGGVIETYPVTVDDNTIRVDINNPTAATTD